MQEIKDNIDIHKILKIAQIAGRSILEVYFSSFVHEYKENNSPITLADKKSHEIICRELKALNPEIPILSEEGKDISYALRESWEYLWLVDPLDGTKEFIQRNGEFALNIALIHNGEVILGIIYVPVMDIYYFARKGWGAYKLEGSLKLKEAKKIQEIVVLSQRLPLDSDKEPFHVVISRSHMSKETEDYINKLKEYHGEIEVISKGSSLKLCMVAEAVADIYPRFGPTMEWDTASGQIIVEEAGGRVVSMNDQQPLRYNKKNLRNPWFIVRARRNYHLKNNY